MLARENKAPVYEYRYEHMGTYSFLDFQMLPLWKNLLKVNAKNMLKMSQVT